MDASKRPGGSTAGVSRLLLSAWLFGLTLLVGQVPQAVQADAPSVSPADAINYVGRMAAVCGVVASAKYAQQTHRQPTFLNLDLADLVVPSATPPTRHRIGERLGVRA